MPSKPVKRIPMYYSHPYAYNVDGNLDYIEIQGINGNMILVSLYFAEDIGFLSEEVHKDILDAVSPSLVKRAICSKLLPPLKGTKCYRHALCVQFEIDVKAQAQAIASGAVKKRFIYREYIPSKDYKDALTLPKITW